MRRKDPAQGYLKTLEFFEVLFVYFSSSMARFS